MARFEDRFRMVVAVFIVFRGGNKILLLKRANTSYRNGEYSLPAGHVDGDQPAVLAAVREAKEETGVAIEPADLRLVHTLHRYSEVPEPHERIDLFFEARKWQGEIYNAEPHKCDELRWSEPERLPDNTIPEVRQALEMIGRGQPYSDFNF